MDVRIGIVQSMKEIELEMAEETDRADIEGQVASAVSADGMLWLTDRKGRRVLVQRAGSDEARERNELEASSFGPPKRPKRGYKGKRDLAPREE